jgi:hypothetical protein
MTDERPDDYEVGMVAALGTRISDARSATGDNVSRPSQAATRFAAPVRLRRAVRSNAAPESAPVIWAGKLVNWLTTRSRSACCRA